MKKKPKKPRTVLAFGTFDLLHPGHLAYLREARSHGSRLVVVVARDSNVKRIKGRAPLNSERSRLAMVKALRIVDRAVLGEKRNMFSVLLRYKPQAVVIGHDQAKGIGALSAFLRKNLPRTKLYRAKAFRPSALKSSIIRHRIAAV